MGLIAPDFDNLLSLLGKNDFSLQSVPNEHYSIFLLPGEHVALNLIPLQNNFTPESLLAIQESYKQQHILLIHLWADVWLTKREQVLDRLKSLSGLNEKTHGRKTEVVRIHKAEADNFMERNHIQGAAKARHKYGLHYDGELVAVATLSSSRLMKKLGSEYRSTELIRFASKGGLTIVGGLTKLLKHYAASHRVQDIMTYADRDWSDGRGYLSAGFIQTEIVEPLELLIDTSSMQRYSALKLGKDKMERTSTYTRAFNTGSLKFLLYL